MDRPTREFALQLMASKDKMESDLAALMDVLKSNNTDMTQPLVDNEGFPRSDIDVYQVRTTRHKVICLRNDLKNLTQKIETVLHDLHAQQREGAGMDENKTSFLNEYDECSPPFAKIGAVTEGSPAEKAGLKPDDLILGFGTLRASNFSNLKDVAQIVQHRLNCEIPLCVRRYDELMQITLIPKTWSGKGFLGCVVLPFDAVDR
ncbi:26S proteasome non-ATPase regulatory subunit 9 [Daphnia magna]|uniref:26S proteasome non-ATPase regulatory subunit 9 n=1 Tax=Daphnia magna TaxID=35525 RepID=A0A0N8D5W6_9CRUS|nr:26S proteasome non-ATPase regulatory subunit 9 [Daphnia magna]KZS19047.1 26S proteasome non-ATPase regulatory subunit 9 [Daphnia magna]